jgi:hypothetical protein
MAEFRLSDLLQLDALLNLVTVELSGQAELPTNEQSKHYLHRSSQIIAEWSN